MSTVHKVEGATSLAKALSKKRADEAYSRIMEFGRIMREVRKVSPAGGDAGVVVRPVSALQQNAALPTKATPQVLNSDGLATKPAAPSIIGTKKPVVIGNGVVTMAGADRSRTAAKQPTSEADDRPFVPLDELGSGGGIVEHLQAHGVSVGIKNGVLTVARNYVPSAKNLIAQLNGGR